MTKIVVFDIDGTLANVDHRRQFVASRPKNWAAWNAGMKNDTVNEDIAFILDTFWEKGNTIILCSGRGEETREVTEQWLKDQELCFTKLFMRKAKDYRKDSIVKVELLQQIREQFGEPFLWFDDRTQVVDAIRAEGVRVLQVAPGDF
jgi:hypothetical protein